MVSSVNERMINAVGKVEDASALVFVGHRDWEGLNRWEKIKASPWFGSELFETPLYTVSRCRHPPPVRWSSAKRFGAASCWTDGPQ